MSEKKYFRVSEVSGLTGIPQYSIRKAVQKGEVDSVKIGSITLVNFDSVKTHFSTDGYWSTREAIEKTGLPDYTLNYIRKKKYVEMKKIRGDLYYRADQLQDLIAGSRQHTDQEA